MEKTQFDKEKFKTWIEHLAKDRNTGVMAIHEWIAEELDLTVTSVRKWVYGARPPGRLATILIHQLMAANPTEEEAKAS